jgi:hypothetical protein
MVNEGLRLHLFPLAGRGRIALAIRVRGYRSLCDLKRGERPLTPTLPARVKLVAAP